MDVKELFTGMTDEVLIEAAAAAFEVAKERGLELPYAAGVLTMREVAEPQKANETSAEVTPLSKESLAKQLSAAYQGYAATIDGINAGEHKNKHAVASEEALTNEFYAWLTSDKLVAAKALLEMNPDAKFTLVATPNIGASREAIIKAAEAFGETQPHRTYVYRTLYDRYTDAQLAGTQPGNGNAIQFSLIPNTKNSEALYGTVEQQRNQLAELQKANSDLKVPSVLEAITFSQTMKAAGEFDGGYDFNRAYIRHFDLREQRLDGWLRVPRFYVDYAGQMALCDSIVDTVDDARLAVG
ncbi:MAG: hypothetical protein JWM81_172 [Candidatus Saccharibacteria bacterium]|nr:hypothetical protein [Candidatus Saccharibacteria bacterium]